MKNKTEELHQKRCEEFEKELHRLLRKHNVEIYIDFENTSSYEDEHFISVDFKEDGSKVWEDGTNDYFRRKCYYL